MFPWDFSSFIWFVALTASARYCVSDPHWCHPTTLRAPWSLHSGLKRQTFASTSLLLGQGGSVAPTVLDVALIGLKPGGYRGKTLWVEADHEQITEPAQGHLNRHCCWLLMHGSYEKSHDKSSKVISEGITYMSSVFMVVFGFIVLSFQTFLQQISQLRKFSLDVS